ncbi:hypothetical protein acdb102_28750 [Acidothermaceae bacterium B102]|nr:hypothetical protein acdb102_28750 [Acidothermaceae bacterium B102]
MHYTRRLVTGTLVGAAVVSMTAAPALAATTTTVAKVTAVKAIVTTSHIVTSHTVHAAGTTFTINGWVDDAGKGIDGQKVYLVERASAKAKWVKATNVKVSWRVTATPRKGVVGYVTYSGVTGLKHVEQYAILHPHQTVKGKVYGASVSKVLTIRP